MTLLKKLILILICAISFSAAAQESNIFWDKTFWATKPNLEMIKTKIKQGHSATQLNPFGFDAVTSSLFAKADNDIVKYLLSLDGNGVNKLTHDGRTYIFWAAYKGNLEIMKYLLHNGAKTDVVDDKGYSILTFAATTGQQDPALYDFLIANGASVLEEKSKDGANALLLLIPHLNDFKMVNYFESKGIDLNSKDSYGNGAFNYTARTGNLDMLKKLVEKGVAYNVTNKNGGNAFMFASQGTRNKTNGLEVYKYLEKLGIKANVTTSQGLNPLHNIAYDVEDINVFKYFITHGVNVNQVDEEGNTPFMNAAAYNTLAVVKYLNSELKDVNTVNGKGQTALTKAISRNSPEVVAFLLQQNANAGIIDSKGNNLTHYLVAAFRPKSKADFLAKAKLLEGQNVDFSTLQANGNTLYHTAIEKQDLELLKLLEPYNIHINTANEEGMTVLHLAAMKAKDDTILKYLISKGARRDIKTSFDETVYDLAAENELLQKHKVNINFLK